MVCLVFGFCMEQSDWGDTEISGHSNPEPWTYHTYPSAESGVYVHLAVDLDAGNVWCRRSNGVGWAGGGDPTAGTSPTLTFTPAAEPMTVSSSVIQSKLTFNFGATPFNGAVPAGFVAWNEVA